MSSLFEPKQDENTMRKEKIKQLVDVMQAYVNGKTIQYYKVDLSFKIEHPGEPNFNDKWVDVDEDHLFRPDFYDYRIKPEEAPSYSISEYHFEYLDNGCTLAGDEFKQCAIGDDDTKKMLGEALLAEVYHHCNLTCSNKVKITMKIESED